jgi:pyruvate formate lyase activating enzyme
MYPRIHAFNKFSEAGPDDFAPTLFLGRCNMKCDYCMNAKLVLESHTLPEIPLEEIKSFVVENRCEWINVSGGEITIHPEDKLINLLKEIKSWGCKIGISTNGSLPNRLAHILPYVNYVTMDIKTDAKKYQGLIAIYTGSMLSAKDSVLASLFLLRLQKDNSVAFGDVDFDYEARTTLYRPLVGESEIKYISGILRRNEKWVLQPFRYAKCMIGKEAYSVKPYTEEEMKQLLLLAKEYNDNVSIRYV